MSNQELFLQIRNISTTDNSIKVSHTSLEPRQALRVRESDQERFIETYCSHRKSGPIHIGELLGEVRPLLIDIDINRPIRASDKEGERMALYTEQDVIHTVNIIQESVAEVFEGCDRMNELQRCVYLEKPSYISRERFKNGFHLHFPYLFSNKKVFEDNLFPRIEELINRYYDHK